MSEKKIALESTVIAHGLPKPVNIDVALELEEIARQNGCMPYTVGIIDGQIKVGLSEKEIVEIGTKEDVMKVGTSEIAVAVALKRSAATTVSATMRIAYSHGIKVFATGGIGGVHSTEYWDVSQDLMELARTRMVVVSAGPKSILDLKSTVEMLETLQITILGYKTDRLPAFYCKSTDLPLTKVESPEQVASIFFYKERLNLPGALLVFNPISDEYAISQEDFEKWQKLAQEDLEKFSVKGKGVTPFLLSRLAYYSNGKTVQSNIELLKSNVRLACDIVCQLSKMQ